MAALLRLRIIPNLRAGMEAGPYGCMVHGIKMVFIRLRILERKSIVKKMVMASGLDNR